MFGSSEDDRGLGHGSILCSELLTFALCTNAQIALFPSGFSRLRLSTWDLNNLFEQVEQRSVSISGLYGEVCTFEIGRNLAFGVESNELGVL